VLRARDGTLFDGVNVENAAYPLGVCGEKTAYVTAVTQGYKPGDFDLIVINASPCGGCRQWHVEFKVDRVVFANNDGEAQRGRKRGDRSADHTHDECQMLGQRCGPRQAAMQRAKYHLRQWDESHSRERDGQQSVFTPMQRAQHG